MLSARFFSSACLPAILAAPLLLGSCRATRNAAKTQQQHPEQEKTSVATLKNTHQLEEKYAALLHVDESRISNLKLYSFIDDWYGVPYKYGGQNKKGIDCSNFAATLYASIYGSQLKGSSASIFNQCKIISRGELREGDLLFFKIDKETISHIAVYLQNNKFVHATTKKGVMIDDLDEPYYKKYFYKAGRPNT